MALYKSSPEPMNWEHSTFSDSDSETSDDDRELSAALEDTLGQPIEVIKSADGEEEEDQPEGEEEKEDKEKEFQQFNGNDTAHVEKNKQEKIASYNSSPEQPMDWELADDDYQLVDNTYISGSDSETSDDDKKLSAALKHTLGQPIEFIKSAVKEEEEEEDFEVSSDNETVHFGKNTQEEVFPPIRVDNKQFDEFVKGFEKMEVDSETETDSTDKLLKPKKKHRRKRGLRKNKKNALKHNVEQATKSSSYQSASIPRVKFTVKVECEWMGSEKYKCRP